MPVTDKEWNDACRAILKAAEASKEGDAIRYGASYAQAGIGMTGEYRRVQALYIRNNLSGWKGEEARAVKAVLIRASK
jgi:hypothetical protein